MHLLNLFLFIIGIFLIQNFGKKYFFEIKKNYFLKKILWLKQQENHYLSQKVLLARNKQNNKFVKEIYYFLYVFLRHILNVLGVMMG